MSTDKKLYVINDIISTTKMFTGDIYGSVVRDIKISGKTQVNDVNIRLDFCYIKPFLTFLNTKYTIEPLISTKIHNGVKIHCYKVSHKHFDTQFSPILLDIVFMNPKMFKIAFIDFDVNLFAENDTSLYLRIVPNSLKYCADKISLLKQRIMNKTFSVVESFTQHKQTEDILCIINKAVEMTILDNWTMDDYYTNKPTWIVGKWENIVIGKHKRKHTNELYHQMISQGECCLCHERFKKNEIVFNTACNHNFHWMCNFNTGLKAWVQQSKTCCPVCRSHMFSGSQDIVNMN